MNTLSQPLTVIPIQILADFKAVKSVLLLACLHVPSVYKVSVSDSQSALPFKQKGTNVSDLPALVVTVIQDWDFLKNAKVLRMENLKLVTNLCAHPHFTSVQVSVCRDDCTFIDIVSTAWIGVRGSQYLAGLGVCSVNLCEKGGKRIHPLLCESQDRVGVFHMEQIEDLLFFHVPPHCNWLFGGRVKHPQPRANRTHPDVATSRTHAGDIFPL